MVQPEALAIRTTPPAGGNQKAPAIRRPPGPAHGRTGDVVTLNLVNLGAALGIEHPHLRGGRLHPGLVSMSAT